MTCSICNKSASKQYYLCDCCFVNLERCTVKKLFLPQEKSVPVIPQTKDVGVGTIEYEGFQDDQEMCTTLLVFRCAVCHQDYTSKEGLWNHLDVHQVAGEDKLTQYQEVRVAHSLLTCTLCNDQRGYQERLYWQHVHEDHDGFFLQCIECGECFRSQKLLNYHALNSCNAREQAVPSISNGATTDSKHMDSQSSESSQDDSNPSHVEAQDWSMSEQDLDKPVDNTVKEISQRFVDELSSGSSSNKCPHCNKECFDQTLLAHHIKHRHPTTGCDICGLIFTNINQARYHKLKHHTEQKHKCPHCPMKFHQTMEYQRHLSKHLEDKKFANEIRHPTETVLPDLKESSDHDVHQTQDQYEFVPIKEEISVEEVTLEQESNVDADANSPIVIHCPLCGGIFGNKDENHLAVHVEVVHQLAICTICGIVFHTAGQLKDHKDQQHSNRKSVSSTERIETIKPRSSHYAHSFFKNPIPPAVPTVHEPDPSHFPDKDTSNCASFDGWEIYSTVPVNDIESHVLSIEYGFRFKSQNVPAKGKMRYYDCRRIKCRVIPQCDRKLLVFIPNTDADATISLKGKHSCGNAPPHHLTRTRLNEMDCDLITNLVQSGVPSRDVKKQFRTVNRAVSDNQLRYAVQSALKSVRK